MTRALLEFLSKRSAGILEKVASPSGTMWKVRVLDRFNMYVHPEDQSVTPCLVRDGFWESWITLWVMNNVDENTLFLDVGANTGYYSFLAYDQGADVVAFEPNPEYTNLVHWTKISEDLSDLRFTLLDTALSNHSGEAWLSIPGDLHGSATLGGPTPGYANHSIKVAVDTLDALLPPEYDGKVVIKIDAEGEEERILEGAEGFLRDSNEVTILMEYTPGKYSDHFVADLLDAYAVTFVDHQGDEQAASAEWILSNSDWAMLVLRPKR